MEGPSSNKRKKSRKDKAASDKSNSDEKLKQSTLLDAFKRGGLVITQETNKASQPFPSRMMSNDVENEANKSGELGHVDLMAAPLQLDMQRFKFRTLNVTCLSLLNYSEVCIYSNGLDCLSKFCFQILIYFFKQVQDSTYSYHESEVLDFNYINIAVKVWCHY